MTTYKNGRPIHLPQLHAPIHEILTKLDDMNITYEICKIDPNILNPLQHIVYSNEIKKQTENDPIWIDDKNNVLDGHHRYVFSLSNNEPINAIKLNTDERTACRILNKIQDIFEYEQQRSMEEVIGDDYINDQNAANSGENRGEFLDLMEKDSASIETDSESDSNNPKTIVAYRKDPIKEDSIIGNFFTLTPVDGYKKYQIDFDNLLDTNDLGITYKSNQIPVEVLAKTWFPHINFEKLGEEYGMPAINLKNKAIAHKAIKMGYDGIKYGETLIQGLK